MDDMTALRTLAERLLGRQFLYDPDADTLRIVVGALPNDLPVPIPLPADATVIGAVTGQWTAIPSPRHPPQMTILFDTSLSAAQVRAFYRERLRVEGWTQPAHMGMTGPGFQFEPTGVHVRELFCRGERGPALWVNAHSKADRPTQVHLELDTNTRHSPCAARPDRVHQPPISFPTLTFPAGSTSLRGGWGGGGWGQDEAHFDATVQTEMDLAALAAHLASQLERAGWERQGSGQDGALAWSTWSFRDEQGDPWRGVLYTLRRPDQERQFMLHLAAEWAGVA